LNSTQQAAAAVLFYNATSWNAGIFSQITCGTVKSWKWANIPSELEWAAQDLGYTNATSWDSTNSSDWPPTASEGWDQLTSTQVLAAEAFGYNRYLWNYGCS
jgi:hypothetical protein